MDELTLDDKKYLSSKQAAKVTGYAKDYVGQLCREGRVTARLVGRNWYVLESSILEHRFGPDDSGNTPLEAENAADTWQSPKYTYESIETVPQLSPKLVDTAVVAQEPLVQSKKVLSDMQSAWQEWFENQKNSEKTLPDASEMLLEDHVEPEIVDEGPVELPVEQKKEPEPRPIEPVIALEPTIHIQRVHDEPQPLNRVVEPFLEAVPVTRSYITRREVALVPPQLEKKSRQRKTQRPHKRPSSHSFSLRAIFFAVAGLAIVATIVGTGLADNFINQKGIASSVTNFISGVNTINK